MSGAGMVASLAVTTTPQREENAWYFAYGSNMGRATFVERRGITPLAVRRAYLDHHRVCFDLPIGLGERGVANLSLAPGARTWGVAYLLSADTSDFLDRTEGVDRGLYRRLSIVVIDDDGTQIPAFAYRGERRDPARKPSARYLGLLLAGARELALPAEYVAWLEAFPLAIDERENETAGR